MNLTGYENKIKIKVVECLKVIEIMWHVSTQIGRFVDTLIEWLVGTPRKESGS